MKGPKHILPQDVVVRLRHDEEIALIDVREQGSFASGHILFASNLPLSTFSERIRKFIPRLKTEIILCDSGEEDDYFAQRAVVILVQLGYQCVRVLAGGVKAWEKSGYPLFTGLNVLSKAFGEALEQRMNPPAIQPNNLRTSLDRGDDSVLLDCRPADEYSAGAIPGAINVPGCEILNVIKDILPSSQTRVFVNCGGRTRGIVSAQMLIEAGLKNPVSWVMNGLIGWELCGFPVVRGAIPTPIYASENSYNWARERTAKLAAKHGVETVSRGKIDGFLRDSHRTNYLFDVRTACEYEENHLRGSSHVPGGQLILKADQYIGIRSARIICIDPNFTRGALTAVWLRRLGYHHVYVYCPEEGELTPTLEFHLMPEECSVPSVTASDLRKLLASDSKPVVVDITDSADYSNAHIPDAFWIVRSRLAEVLQGFPNGLPIILTSKSGRSATAALYDDIDINDKSQIQILSGGTDAWVAAGNLTEKGMTNALCAVDDIFPPPNAPHPQYEQRMRDYIAWELDLPKKVLLDPLWNKLMPITQN